MSNYTQTTAFTPKDTLPTSDPNKTIFGAAFDVEFGNISTAIASKFDAANGVGVIAFLAAANTFTKAQIIALSTAATTGLAITSSATFTGAAPGASIRSTAASGDVFFSLAANSNVIGTSDFFLEQAGATNIASISNRANAALTLATNGTTAMITLAATGAVTIATPSSGTALVLPNVSTRDSLTAAGFGMSNNTSRLGVLLTPGICELWTDSTAGMCIGTTSTATSGSFVDLCVNGQVVMGVNGSGAAGVVVNNVGTVALTVYEKVASLNAQKTVATYDQQTTSVNMTGGTTTPAVVVTYTRVGRQIFAQIPSVLMTYSAGIVTLPASIPTGYRPAAVVDAGTTVVSSGSGVGGVVRAKTNGDIEFYSNPAGSNLAGSCGPNNVCITWSI